MPLCQMFFIYLLFMYYIVFIINVFVELYFIQSSNTLGSTLIKVHLCFI